MAAIHDHIGHLLLALFLVALLALVGTLATAVRGGSLDPTDSPGSTMHALDDSPVVWDRALSAVGGCNSERFKCVFGGGGVLDEETGLVWEQSPSTALQNWFSAIRRCQQDDIAGRHGWRAPKIEELRSILEGTGLLPAGLFSNIQLDDSYWSTSDSPENSFRAATHQFGVAVNTSDRQKDEFLGLHVWCVRGAGAGSDYQGNPPP